MRNQITDNITNKTKKAENVTDLGNLLEPFESHLNIRHIKDVMLSLIFNMWKYAMGVYETIMKLNKNKATNRVTPAKIYCKIFAGQICVPLTDF